MRTFCAAAILYLSLCDVGIAQVTLPIEQRIAAIRNTAVEIWRIQRSKGNATAITMTNECRANLRNSKKQYDNEVEACLVLDYYVSFSTASFYEQLSDEYRRANNIDPSSIRTEAAKRLASAYAHFSLSQDEAALASRLLREHVFQAVADAAGVK